MTSKSVEPIVQSSNEPVIRMVDEDGRTYERLLMVSADCTKPRPAGGFPELREIVAARATIRALLTAWAVSSAVRASGLHPEGPAFKSLTAHHLPDSQARL